MISTAAMEEEGDVLASLGKKDGARWIHAQGSQDREKEK
jgi:hypothetical protein